jgi:S-(hydroxymethyl)glutathione dehydrogenase/alcohol dehydrogenase
VPATRYRHGGGFINAGAVTTFNEYAVVSENRCVALPDGVPLDVAVLFGCALLTGAGIVTHEIQPAPGSSIAVFGLGGIGMSALMTCRLYELEQLIAIDVAPEKRHLAAELGATATIDPSACDPVAEVRRLTNGKGVDYSIEAAGLSQTIEQAFGAVRRGGGRCVFASHPHSGERMSLDPYELIAGKQISGSWGGSSDPDRDIPRFADLYRSGKLPLERLLPHRYALDEINGALDDLEQRRAGRPLIVIDASVG